MPVLDTPAAAPTAGLLVAGDIGPRRAPGVAVGGPLSRAGVSRSPGMHGAPFGQLGLPPGPAGGELGGLGEPGPLLRARELPGGASIVVPTFQGRRGHPTLTGWRHVEGIRGLPTGTGLNVYLRQQAAETRELVVDCPNILTDLDTPEDYENRRRRFPDLI
jgi:hypothetical protein